MFCLVSAFLSVLSLLGIGNPKCIRPRWNTDVNPGCIHTVYGCINFPVTGYSMPALPSLQSELAIRKHLCPSLRLSLTIDGRMREGFGGGSPSFFSF